MKPLIIVCDGMSQGIFHSLQSIPEFEVFPEPLLTQNQLKELLPKASALVIRSSTQVDTNYLDMAPALKYIIRAGAGTDNINKKACQQKNIKVSNTPGANNNSAAEHAIALMLTVLRKTAFADYTMKNSGWDKSKFIGNELSNKKIGIIGLGQIGKIVAKRLQGFEPDIQYYDPFCTSINLPKCTKVENLEEIFETCDIITIHTPLLNETKGLVSEQLLNKMQPHAILINASRGGIVDEEALYDLLRNNQIRGAGVDVFSSEPLPSDNKLRELKNIVLTPHIGASTEEAQLRVGEMAVHQLKEFFLQDNLLNEVRI